MLGLRQSLPPGSPPHTRGKLDFLYLNAISLWITPAYAGKIRSAVLAHSQPEDHPRIRGENSLVSPKASRRRGSPPHTRGKLPMKQCHFSAPGITPAYAGKINVLFCEEICAPDHPRIRGENTYSPPSSVILGGSPPHTRGKCVCVAGNDLLPGITPAYAGKMRKPLPAMWTL